MAEPLDLKVGKSEDEEVTELKEDGSDLETERVFLRKIFLGLMVESFIIVQEKRER